MVIRASILDRAVEAQLLKLEGDIKLYPYSYNEKTQFTEKEKIEYAFKEAKRYDEADWQIMATLTFFFWWVVAPVFGIKRGIEWLGKKRFKIFTLSRFENRLKELDEIDLLKKKALEDKNKYEEALKLLRAEGINVGE